MPFESVADYGAQAVGVTYRFDAPAAGMPDGLLLRIEGRRNGVEQPTERDSFALERKIPPLPPACGEVAVTLRAVDVELGDWTVDAVPLSNPGSAAPGLPRARGIGRSGFAPVVRVKAPGVILGAWPGLVLAGVVLGLVTQAVLASHVGVAVLASTLLLLVACLLGLVGAKTYFLVLHPDRQTKGLPQTGLAVQGFVLVTIATVIIGASVLGIAVPTLLDTTGAGLLVGMTVGRLGCFFGGCCVGRPTASRWGCWSSDRFVGVRRIPTQLMESLSAGVLAAVAITLVWLDTDAPDGLVFIGSVAAYTAARQLLFPLRDVPRTTATGRYWVLGLCAATLVLALVSGVVGALR